MPRPVWSGSISFGLVSVPVKLFTATENHSISFHQFQRGTGERIHHKRVAESSGDEVPYDDIVKGYEVSSGEHVLLEREELDAIEPGRTRAVEIEDFVDLHEADRSTSRRPTSSPPRATKPSAPTSCCDERWTTPNASASQSS